MWLHNVVAQENAHESAANHLDLRSFWRSSLLDQLVFDGYTRRQAEFGANQVGL